ncbi:phosphate signaling complex protein PhoU [Flavobacterium sp.]|uniref:phosphate signaling complex protein PhoU n=1 Tax=Flavobacterium sp. TaxID=239 RepID=UPI002B4AB780|nr:phosphate signaling complex protein PhoU [Flavobacterium sp.]HLF50723.1 phosphate signaling complex protein PhoU [Flavobacterium sp.]
MASQLETELAKLKSAIIKISNLAENQVFEAMGVLLSEPISEKKEVKKTESKIDKLDVKIEDICQGVFALQQPVASDLRFIMSAMQMSNEIERIGDLAMSVIKLSKNINAKHELIAKFNITEIAKEVESIVIKTNLCFQTLDEKAIGEIFGLNSSIKLKGEAAIQNIIGEMKDNSKSVVSGTNLIMVLKHLERMGEHCTNIAESVYFMINAKIIKHEKNLDKK